MSLEGNGDPDIKADNIQSCVGQQWEDPFILVRASRKASGGGGIDSRLFRHCKHERKCRWLRAQWRELLAQSRLEGVWGKEIRAVGRPSHSCTASPRGEDSQLRHWSPLHRNVLGQQQ